MLLAWGEVLTQARRNPSLKQLFLQREGELLPQFAELYEKLKALYGQIRK
jgi:hypothetical protein